MLGILSGVLFAYAATCRKSPPSTTIGRARSAASTRRTARSSASSPSSAGWSSATTTSPALARGDHRGRGCGLQSHFGLSISRIVMRLTRDVVEAMTESPRAGRRAGRRQHVDAAARAQPLRRRVGYRIGDTSLERKIKEAHRRDADREAVHEARDPDALRQPELFRPRHVRRRGRVAPVLRQIGQGREPRRSGAARRHHPVARAPEPVRRHRPRRPGGATTCCSGWPTRATSRQTRPKPPRQKPIVVAGQPQQPGSIAPYFVEEVRKHLEQQYGAKALYESGLSVTTTLDRRCSRSANRAIEHGLRRDRQAARLPQADAQRRRRQAHDRRLQGRPLAAADRRRRHRPGGRRRSRQDRRRTARACGSARTTPT